MKSPVKNLDRFTKNALVLLFVGHLIAVFTSFGYHHPDEHFQILEFANTFLGWGDPTLLAWEFGEQMRSWFQPMIHVVIMKLLSALGIYQSFPAATLFRALYAVANIWVILQLWIYFQKRFSLKPIWFLFIASLWFFPYIHVRTSSENLAGIFLSLALVALARDGYWKSGILFGFAFIARFQIALGLVGVAFALLWRDRKITKNHWKMFLGFLVPIAFGAILDRIGYGNWVLTPYRYFKLNLIDGKSALYSPYPFYQYFVWIAQLNPFVSLPILYGVIRYIFKWKLDVFSTFTTAFIFVHCFISNKEYRFLFPIINFAPFMAAAYFSTASDFAIRGFQKLWFKAFVGFFIVISLSAFAASTLHGAANQKLWIPHAVYRFHTRMPERWISNVNYVETNRGLFYDIHKMNGLENHEVEVFESNSELLALMNKRPVSVVIDGSFKNPVIQSMITTLNSHCKKVASAYPEIISIKLNVRYEALYRCE